MIVKGENAWWAYSIEEKLRSDKQRSRLVPITEAETGIKLTPTLSYESYLQLDALLNSQSPTSAIPDERTFITTHQCFELQFKQMLFDLDVIATTLTRLLLANTKDFGSLSLSSDSEALGFWRPALTASSRLKLSSERILPDLMRCLGGTAGEDDPFSSVEFYRFRDNLFPASGFQSAQFRLIQRAFGKSGLFSLRLFPAQAYANRNSASRIATTNVVDPRILGQSAQIATPTVGSPFSRIPMIDELAHFVLSRMPSHMDNEFSLAPIEAVQKAKIDIATRNFGLILANHRQKQEDVGAKPVDADDLDRLSQSMLLTDLSLVVEEENNRRELLGPARRGAFYLHSVASSGYLARVLNALIDTDRALFGSFPTSFLSLHYQTAKKRIGEASQHAEDLGEQPIPSGTGGGGIEYLGFMINDLIPLFRFLIAYRDLEEPTVWSWIETEPEEAAMLS